LAATGVAVPDILVKIYDLFAAGNAAGASEMYDRYASYIRYEV
jgi:4-hydroxy-tetrahydrodipicolinate synthase